MRHVVPGSLGKEHPVRKSYMNIGLATADEDCFLEPTLQSIAAAHGKTVGQVLSAPSAIWTNRELRSTEDR